MADRKTIFIVRGVEALLDDDANESFFSTETQPGEDDDVTSQHAASVYGDNGTPAPDREAPMILRVTTDQMPKAASLGFVIGRNKHNCDIVLKDARVSDTQLSLNLNVHGGTILVKNLSKHGTRVKFSRDDKSMVIKGSTQVLLNFEAVDIQLSKDLSIQIQRFADPMNWETYRANYADEDGNPSVALLGLDTLPETSNASKRAPVYIQDRRLGEGAFGQVFRAVERYTGNVYAMKLYNKPEKARWQEPVTLQRVNHEYIVRYVAYSHVSGQSAQLIMEYVQGPNLQEFLDPRNNHTPLRMSEAREILRQLLEAADYLHSMEVTHRDIKPSNIILVSRDPIHTKLVDFGFATDVSSFKTNCGTPLYLAPELLSRRHGRRSNKVDIFAIGVVALSLFGISVDISTATGPWDCLQAVLHQRQLLAASHQSPQLAQHELIVGLLSERPDDRPSARDCLAHSFFQQDFDLDDFQGSRSVIPDLQTQVLRPGQGLDIATVIASTPAGLVFDSLGESASSYQQAAPRRSITRESSSSLSQPRKRPKQGRHTRGARSTAPSPTSSRRHQTSHTPIAAVQDDKADKEVWGYSNMLPSSDVPETESCGSAKQQWASGSGPGGPESIGHDGNEDEEEEEYSGTGLHSGCWMDAMHALGGGSSLARHGDKDDGRASGLQPVSDTTPNFSSGMHRSVHSVHSQNLGIPGSFASQHDHDQTAQAREQEDCDNASEEGGDGEGDEPVDFHAEGDGGGDEEEEEEEDDDDDDETGGQEPPNREERATNRAIRRRKSTSQRNKALLEAEYQQNPRPSKADYVRLAQMVSLDNKQLQVWFTNRRHRDRRNPHQGTGTADVPAYTGTHAYEPLASPAVRADPTDGWLNFGDICTAAQADETTRGRCLRLISGHSVVSCRRHEQWISFEDGWFLCQKLGLDPTFLMSCPQAPPPAEPPRLWNNYLFLRAALPPAYSILWWNGKAIPYLPGARTVNAASLVQSMGLRRNAVQNWLAKRTIARSYVKGHSTVQGTYMGLDDALQLCMDRGLSVQPVQAIAGECGVQLNVSAAVG